MIPGLAKALPKISDGGKTYTLFLRKGLKYSDGTPVKASDFTYAVERALQAQLAAARPSTPTSSAPKSSPKRRRAASPGSKPTTRPAKSSSTWSSRAAPSPTSWRCCSSAPLPPDTPAEDLSAEPAAGDRPLRDHQLRARPRLDLRAQPAVGEGQREADAATCPAATSTRSTSRSIRNPSTQVNDVEQGKFDWMENPPPADRYAEVKSKYEGTQFRVEPHDQHLLLLDEHDRRRRSTTSRCARRSTTRSTRRRWNGSTPARSTATQQILPPGMPGYKKFELYPHDMAKAKRADRRSQPRRPRDHRLDRRRSPNNEAGDLLRGRARRNSASTRR